MIPNCILAIEDENDRAFMESLYLNYQRLMYHEIYKMVNDPWATEDIVQTTLVKLIDKVTLLRSINREQLINYIITASKNAARNYIRDSAHKREFALEDAIDSADDNADRRSMEACIIAREEVNWLVRIWPMLDAKSQRILEGYYILEKPMAELAKDLNIKPKSVRMALTRARKNARHLLQNTTRTL